MSGRVAADGEDGVERAYLLQVLHKLIYGEVLYVEIARRNRFAFHCRDAGDTLIERHPPPLRAVIQSLHVEGEATALAEELSALLHILLRLLDAGHVQGLLKLA